jgi:hypothetical protein
VDCRGDIRQGAGWCASNRPLRFTILVRRRGQSERGSDRRLLPVAVAAAATALTLSANAVACPRCYTSHVARAMAFGPAFWPNLLAITLPFLVLAAVTVAFDRIGAPRGSRPEQRP